jgi:hypothetical protein
MVRHLRRVDGAARGNPRFVLCRALTVVIVACAAPQGRSSDLIWDGAGESPPDGRFNESINWNDDTQFPEAGDTATFNINEEYSVTFNANAVSDALTVAAGSPILRGVNLIIRTYDVGPAGAGAHDLVVNGGGTLRVGPSMTLNVHDLVKIGDVGDGTIVVNGNRSAFNVLGTSGSNLMAQNGNIARLTYSNAAQGTIAAPLVLASAQPNATSAFLTVSSDADLQVGSLDIGTNASSTAAGSVTVSDAGSTLTMSGESTLMLGGSSSSLGILNVYSSGVFNTGTGAITVNDTGHISVVNGTLNLNGDITLDGGTLTRTSGSIHLAPGRTVTAKNEALVHLDDFFGLDGGSTWNIDSGADLITTGYLWIGATGSGSATLVVDGAGSSLQAGAGTCLWGHTSQAANVTIRNGATAVTSNLELALGGFPGSSGTLNIESGAVMTTGHLSVGHGGGQGIHGTVTIDGPGSTLTQNGTSTLTLGHASSSMATVNIRNGGQFNTGTGAVSVRPTAQVLLDGTNASFHAKGPMTVNGSVQLGSMPGNSGGTLDVDAGLTIDGGTVSVLKGVVDADAITLANGGSFDFVGGTLHVEDFNGNLVNQGGTLAPGNSVGATSISGNYTQQSAATLKLEIGGVFLGQWDVVTVEGNANLDGAIEVTLTGGFQPVIGNSFTVLSTNVGNIGGQFDTEVFPIFGGLTFDLVYNPKSVALHVVAASVLPGDLNENGVVDAADYVVWRKADGTQDGYNAWRANFGRTAGSGAAVSDRVQTAVPEPVTLLLMFIAAIAAPMHRRQIRLSEQIQQ